MLNIVFQLESYGQRRWKTTGSLHCIFWMNICSASFCKFKSSSVYYMNSQHRVTSQCFHWNTISSVCWKPNRIFMSCTFRMKMRSAWFITSKSSLTLKTFMMFHKQDMRCSKASQLFKPVCRFIAFHSLKSKVYLSSCKAQNSYSKPMYAEVLNCWKYLITANCKN